MNRMIQFGECAVNERLDALLRIENNTEDLVIPFEFSKVAHFKTDPVKDRLHPMSDRTVLITFQPKNMGIFSTPLILSLVNGIYEVPIKLNGIARKIGTRTKPIRGPEATKKDFVEERKYFQEDKAQKQVDRIKGGESSIPPWLKETTTWQVDQDMKGTLTEGVDQTKIAAMKSNAFLKEQRIKREVKAMKDVKMKRMAKNFPRSLEEYLNDIDLNLEQGRPPSPKLVLNTTNDPLWVVKAVGLHEPSALESKRKIEFDSNRPLRKQPYDFLPKGEEQNAHCSTELSGTDLQKIAVGPITIDFGNLFVNSEEIRYFHVSNDLHQFILVKFLDTKDTIQIIPEQQVIPRSAVASFTLKFKSSIPQDHSRAIPYKINDNHTFNICVKAKVEPVKLEVSPPTLNFQMTSDNLERSMETYFRIVNPGNWIARYNIDLIQPNQAFKMQTGQFAIDKRDTKQFKVIYTPTEDTQIEDAKIVLSIMDGDKMEIVCRGSCPKGDCDLVDKGDMDFGEVQVGATESEERYIKIKNRQSREAAIVHVDISAIPELRLKSTSPLRMHPNEEASVALTLVCTEQKAIEGDVLLFVRGGKTLIARVKANVIIPDVTIEEEAFDFGLITSQGPKTTPITFINKSNIQAMLIMNLETERELLIIRPPGQNEKEGVLEPITDQKKELSKDNIDAEMSEEEEILNQGGEAEQGRKFKIGVPAKSKFILWLKFTPDITIHDKRVIPLPIEIRGVGKTNGIRRSILVETKQPKISLDPVKLEFEDKVVTGKPYHTSKDLIVLFLLLFS